MSADLFLKNARLVLEHTVLDGGLAITDGRISQVVAGAGEVDAATVLDLRGLTVLPGLVDSHVHFNQPGRDHWEGYRTGTMAAAAGGVTTILEMPLNATPPTITAELLAQKRASVAGDAVVDYGQWGGLVNNNLADLEALDAGGVIGFKAFLSNSGVDFERIDDDLIFAGLECMKHLGNVLGVHAENEYVARYLGSRLRAYGRTDRASWSESRPPAVEIEAVQRAAYWAGVTGGNLHVVHVTVPAAFDALAQARRGGANVTGETCPHYLCLDEQDFERLGPAAKCAPPLRARREVEGLWTCVFDGLVETIGSDHSPCPWEDKAPGLQDIWKAWGGISGVQTMLPALLSEGVNKRGLPLPTLARLTATNPARLFGLYPQKGALVPGADADLAVVDLDARWTLSVDDLLYKNKHSAYVGMSFQGHVERTFVRGREVYGAGRIQAPPGYGQLVKRTHRYGATA